MSIDTVFAFLAAALFLAFVPGPDNLFVMTQAALRGRRAGLTITLGLCTGLIVHTTAVALGVAVIFQQSELAFSLLKYAGAAYLTWLAWLAFRAKPTAAKSSTGPAREGARLYLRGIVMNITNPKVSIFFLAFLPQFVDKQAGHVTLQMFALGGLFIIATLIAFSLMALFAASAGARFGQSPAAQKVMNKIAGVVFLGLALKLATAER
ncbi:Threonine/homoserine/homoserine lactone efflux protein [Phytobacter palmae]|nr:Threonine/homoserine/homoserine lactone efflux protein [Phytobacter palmae]